MTRWATVDDQEKEFLKTAWGQDVISYRTYLADLHVSDNPFGANNIDSLKNILLLEKNDHTLVFKEVIEPSGVVYSDRL